MRRGADAIKRSEIAVAVGLRQRRRVRRFAGVFRRRMCTLVRCPDICLPDICPTPGYDYGYRRKLSECHLCRVAGNTV